MTKLLVIDTETGGTDPDRHSLLSLAAVLWEDGTLKAELVVLIAEPDLAVTARALEINHIDIVGHCRQAVQPTEAMSLLREFIAQHFNQELTAGEQIVLAGHNVSFDVGFLRRLCRLAGSDFPSLFSHRMLDTASILRFLSLAGLLPATATASSEAFAQLGVNVSAEERHTALGDARATARLLTRLVEMISPAGIELRARTTA